MAVYNMKVHGAWLPLAPALSRQGRGGVVARSAFQFLGGTVQHRPFSPGGRRTG
jgi:hypothetical protein